MSDLRRRVKQRTRFACWDALKRSPYNLGGVCGAENESLALGRDRQIDGIKVAGDGNFPFEFFLDGGLQGLGGGGFAVDQVGLFWRSGKAG
jgi:hypothetical protein